MDSEHFNLGKEIIIESAEHHLRGMENAERVVWNVPYADPYIFEMSLRRVGEDELAESFVNPTPNKNDIVRRVHCRDHILTAIIVNLERGDINFASELETLQREEFYMEGVGYVDPHFKPVMKPWQEKKDILRKGILEKGLEGNRRYRERLQTGHFFQRIRRRPASFKDGRYDDEGRFQIGNPSLTETIYAVYANLALSNTEHVRSVLKDIADVYKGAESELFLGGGIVGDSFHFNYDNTASVLRAQGLAGDHNAGKLFERMEKGIMNLFKEDLQKDSQRFHPERMVSLSLALDYFNRYDSLAEIKNLAKNQIYPQYLQGARKEDEQEDIFVVGNSFYEDATLCKIGLALAGLEKGKPNQFYCP